jgi:hypothetical protein
VDEALVEQQILHEDDKKSCNSNIKAEALWSIMDGYIPDGDDLHVAIMTVDEAKLAASNQIACQGCKGFCHAGPPTDEPVTIYFKAKFNVVNRKSIPQWTSYLPVEDGMEVCLEVSDEFASETIGKQEVDEQEEVVEH